MKYFYYGIGYLILMAALAFLGYGLFLMWEAGHSLPLVILVVYVIYLVSCIVLFIQRRHSQAKISWFMIMVLLPILGQVLYLIFGQRYKHRKELSEYRQKETFGFEEKTPNDNDILSKQANISNRGIYGAHVEVYGNVNLAYRKLFEDLQNAKREINIHYYIIKPGEIFEHFKTILVNRVRAGVRVRLIVDDFGRWALPWYKIKELKEAGVEVAIFGKVHFPFIGSSNGYRTHRKMVIIDSNIVHTGGINIADEYASLNKQYGLWVDYNTRMAGPIVRSYILLFADDWKLVTKEELDVKEQLSHLKSISDASSQVVMVESSPEINSPQLKDSFISLILSAKESITLVSPYLVPPIDVISALRASALSGVRVKLFIPGRPDKKSVWIGSRAYAKNLMEFGVEIYELNNILAHSKIGIFDNKYAYFGTANIDIRSFYSQFEITNVASGKVVQDLGELMANYQVMSTRLTKEDLRLSRWKERWLNIFVLLFSPLM